MRRTENGSNDEKLRLSWFSVLVLYHLFYYDSDSGKTDNENVMKLNEHDIKLIDAANGPVIALFLPPWVRFLIGNNMPLRKFYVSVAKMSKLIEKHGKTGNGNNNNIMDKIIQFSDKTGINRDWCLASASCGMYMVRFFYERRFSCCQN